MNTRTNKQNSQKSAMKIFTLATSDSLELQLASGAYFTLKITWILLKDLVWFQLRSKFHADQTSASKAIDVKGV